MLVAGAVVSMYFTGRSDIDFNTEVKPIFNKKCISCHGGVKRHPAEQAAELVKIAMMDPVVNDADHKEHARRADAVADHLEHRAFNAHVPVIGVVESSRCR